MAVDRKFKSTTVEITIGYLTDRACTRGGVSTTVEITIGYLTSLAIYYIYKSTTVEITIGYLTIYMSKGAIYYLQQ